MTEFFEANSLLIICVLGVVCLGLIVTGIVLLVSRRGNDGFDRKAASRAAYPARIPAAPVSQPVSRPIIRPVNRPETETPRSETPQSPPRPARPLSRPILKSERTPAEPEAPVTVTEKPVTLSEAVLGGAGETVVPMPRPEPARPVVQTARPVQPVPQRPVQEEPSFSGEQRLLMLKSHELLLTLADGVKKLSNAKTEASRKERLAELLTAVASLDAKNETEGYNDFFGKMNPELWTKVQARSTEELTPYEMRLCAMLSLGMSVKEIAEIGGKSVRTVETSVYKLRKKLDIPAEAKASDFLRSL